MNWKEQLIHYQEYDDIKNEEMLGEAIASCESLFETMDKDELHNHNRVLAISYLALLNERDKVNN